MDDIFIFCEFLSNLNVAVRNGRPAPHKAVLLLSIAEMARKGQLSSDEICLSQTLRDTFSDIWIQYVSESTNFACNPETPFKKMDSEPFWTSVNESTGRIADELLCLFKDDNAFSVLKTTLVNNYLDTASLTATSPNNDVISHVGENSPGITSCCEEYDLDEFVSMFSNIRVNSSAGRKLPHKAIMMLTILDLICSGYIDSNRIECNKELKAQFRYNWCKYANDTSFVNMPDIKKLLVNMSKEKFWQSFSQEDAIATLRPSLFELIKDRRNCFALRFALANKFLPKSIENFTREYEIVNADYKQNH